MDRLKLLEEFIKYAGEKQAEKAITDIRANHMFTIASDLQWLKKGKQGKKRIPVSQPIQTYIIEYCMSRILEKGDRHEEILDLINDKLEQQDFAKMAPKQIASHFHAWCQTYFPNASVLNDKMLLKEVDADEDLFIIPENLRPK